MLNRKVVADSSCDLTTFEDAPFALASLKIITNEKEYVDDARLDVAEMVDDLRSYSGHSSTSCTKNSFTLFEFFLDIPFHSPFGS